MPLQQEVKVNLLYWYIENGRSVVKTQRAFKVYYKTKKAPTRNTINDIVKKMEESGSVCKRPQKARQMTARTSENIGKIRKKMTDSPHSSSRRLS